MKQAILFLIIIFSPYFQSQIISSDITRYGGDLMDYSRLKVITKTYSDGIIQNQNILDYDLGNLVRSEISVEKGIQFSSYWEEDLKNKMINFYYVQMPRDTLFRQTRYLRDDFQDSITITDRPGVKFVSVENFYDDENRLIKNVKYNGDGSIFKTNIISYNIDGNCTTSIIEGNKNQMVCIGENEVMITFFNPIEINDFDLNLELSARSRKIIYLNQKSMVKKIEYRNPDDELVSDLNIIYIK